VSTYDNRRMKPADIALGREVKRENDEGVNSTTI
jgi:hypothetical protein